MVAERDGKYHNFLDFFLPPRDNHGTQPGFETMIHLIGVDHRTQYFNQMIPPELFDEFKEFIIHHARTLKATLLAEEFHEEYLKEVYFSPSGTLRSVAMKLQTAHRYCDPCDHEKEKLGIPFYADIRESVVMELGFSKDYFLDPQKRNRAKRLTAKLVYAFFPVRESFWIARLEENIFARVIFICGHEHITSFTQMLLQRGIPCRVIAPFWKGDFFKDFTS